MLKRKRGDESETSNASSEVDELESASSPGHNLTTVSEVYASEKVKKPSDESSAGYSSSEREQNGQDQVSNAQREVDNISEYLRGLSRSAQLGSLYGRAMTARAELILKNAMLGKALVIKGDDRCMQCTKHGNEECLRIPSGLTRTKEHSACLFCHLRRQMCAPNPSEGDRTIHKKQADTSAIPAMAIDDSNDKKNIATNKEKEKALVDLAATNAAENLPVLERCEKCQEVNKNCIVLPVDHEYAQKLRKCLRCTKGHYTCSFVKSPPPRHSLVWLANSNLAYKLGSLDRCKDCMATDSECLVFGSGHQYEKRYRTCLRCSRQNISCDRPCLESVSTHEVSTPKKGQFSMDWDTDAARRNGLRRIYSLPAMERAQSLKNLVVSGIASSLKGRDRCSACQTNDTACIIFSESKVSSSMQNYCFKCIVRDRTCSWLTVVTCEKGNEEQNGNENVISNGWKQHSPQGQNPKSKSITSHDTVVLSVAHVNNSEPSNCGTPVQPNQARASPSTSFGNGITQEAFTPSPGRSMGNMQMIVNQAADLLRILRTLRTHTQGTTLESTAMYAVERYRALIQLLEMQYGVPTEEVAKKAHERPVEDIDF